MLMRAVQVSTSTSGTYTGAGSAGIPLDIHRGTFNVGIFVVPLSAGPAVNIQYSPNSPFVSATSMHWFPLTALTSVSTTQAAVLTTPCQALRIVQTEVGDAKITIIQAGLVNN